MMVCKLLFKSLHCTRYYVTGSEGLLELSARTQPCKTTNRNPQIPFFEKVLLTPFCQANRFQSGQVAFLTGGAGNG